MPLCQYSVNSYASMWHCFVSLCVFYAACSHKLLGLILLSVIFWSCNFSALLTGGPRSLQILTLRLPIEICSVTWSQKWPKIEAMFYHQFYGYKSTQQVDLTVYWQSGECSSLMSFSFANMRWRGQPHLSACQIESSLKFRRRSVDTWSW